MVSLEEISKQYVQEYISRSEHLPEICYDLDLSEDKLEHECIKYANDITDKKITLATFTTYLESFLTAQTAFNRKRGAWILSTVLDHLPKDLLTENELAVLVRFYSDRINDNHVVVPALIKGICAIVKMKHFPKDSTQIILNSVFVHIQFDVCSTLDRGLLYRMLYLFLDLRTEEVKNMGLDFVNGIIQGIDGERDPGNLLFIFSWLPKFFRTVTMSHLLEDSFEVVSCYFPVDYRNQQNENQNLTRENLAEGLETCLCAVPEFGEFCIPLALEKLDSDLKNAIIDSLNLLIRGCNTFPSEKYELHFFEIWHILKKYLFTTTNSEISKCALKCLTAILTLITSDKQNDKKILTEILNIIKNETQKSLIITSKEFEIGTTVLLAVANVNSLFCTHIMDCMIPTLLSQYYLEDNYLQEIKILNILNEFCQIYLKFFKNFKESVHLTAIPQMLLTALNHKEYEMRICGWQGFTNILHTFDEHFKNEFLKVITSAILNENNLHTRKSLYKFLEQFIVIFENDCNEHIINSQYYDNNNIFEIKNFLNTLIILTNSNNAQKILLKLRSYCFSNGNLYRIEFLDCYKQITYNLVKNKTNIDCIDFIDHFICSNLKYLEEDEKIHESIISISKLIVYNLMTLANYDINIVLKYIDTLIIKFENAENDNRIIIVSLLYGLLIGLRRSDQLNNKKYVFEILLNITTMNTNELMIDLAVKILASMLNKWEDNSFDELVHQVLEKIKTSLEIASIEENVNKLLSWFTKALVMRNSKYGIELINTMCNRLITVKSLATNFAILIHDNGVLCSHNDCQISLLYRQKITVNCLKQILQLRKSERKLQYSVAILNLLIYLPLQLFVHNYNEFIEVIIECLDSNIPFLCLMALKKIEYVVLNENELFGTYLSDITPILLKLTTSESMEVRLNSLQCLEYITNSTNHLVTPFKIRVIHGLGKCLDDPKRLVRTQAIKTRLAWYKIGNQR